MITRGFKTDIDAIISVQKHDCKTQRDFHFSIWVWDFRDDSTPSVDTYPLVTWASPWCPHQRFLRLHLGGSAAPQFRCCPRCPARRRWKLEHVGNGIAIEIRVSKTSISGAHEKIVKGEKLDGYMYTLVVMGRQQEICWSYFGLNTCCFRNVNVMRSLKKRAPPSLPHPHRPPSLGQHSTRPARNCV